MAVDFQEVKSRVSIEDAARKLGLQLKPNGDQLRGRCPVCSETSATDDRSLVVTPSKNLFYCFKAKKGGDQLLLAAHVRNEGIKDAAQFLSTMPEENDKPKDREKTGHFDPEKYILSLDRKHPLVEQLGFTEADCLTYGLGVSAKGAHKGRFCIPLRDTNGQIVVFVSVTELKLPNRWRDG